MFYKVVCFTNEVVETRKMTLFQVERRMNFYLLLGKETG